MIRSERRAESLPEELADWEIAPGVWLRQEEVDGQFVEIILPSTEMQQLIEECERDFPRYAVKLTQRVAARNDSPEEELHFDPSQIQGIFNTQLLGTVLVRHQIYPRVSPDSSRAFPYLQQPFGLAMRGRLRLTADLQAQPSSEL